MVRIILNNKTDEKNHEYTLNRKGVYTNDEQQRGTFLKIQ